MVNLCHARNESRDSNPGPVFSIPGFGIGEFLIPAELWDPGGMISKTVIIEYNGLILLILRLLSRVTGLCI